VRALIVWSLVSVAMIVQGVAREGLVAPSLGELAAHQLTSLFGCLIVFLGSVLALPWLGIVGNPRGQLRVGLLWLLLTVSFEFAFGRWVAGHSWSRLLQDYDLLAGRLWLLVLGATLLSPWLAGRWHARRGRC